MYIYINRLGRTFVMWLLGSLPTGVNLPTGIALPTGVDFPTSIALPAGVNLPAGILPAGGDLPTCMCPIRGELSSADEEGQVRCGEQIARGVH